MTLQLFRYQNMQGFSYCKLPKPFFDSKFVKNIQNEDNYCFLCCFVTHLHEVDIPREKVSNFKMYFTEFNESDVQFLLKTKRFTKTWESKQNKYKYFWVNIIWWSFTCLC